MTQSPRILVIDDDRFLLEQLKRLLELDGNVVRTVTSGEEGLSALESNAFDLVILDLGLPGIDGVSTCRRMRAQWHMPILMLTARTDAMDKVIGLEVGADDYLTKPFEAPEFMARVRAQLRRQREYQGGRKKIEPKKEIVVGDLAIDIEQREATFLGKLLELTHKEFEILLYLAENLGRAIGREQLFEHIWGYEMAFNSNSLDVYVYRVRKKLDNGPENPDYIQTLRGFGYKMVSPTE